MPHVYAYGKYMRSVTVRDGNASEAILKHCIEITDWMQPISSLASQNHVIADLINFEFYEPFAS